MTKIDFENRERVRLNKEEDTFFNSIISRVKKKDKSEYKNPEEFINYNMGSNKFSYHQINIFIRLFMECKNEKFPIEFIKYGKNVIEKYAQCTRYFTLGTYAKELTKSLDEKNDISSQKDTTKSIKDKDIQRKENYSSNYQSNIKLSILLDNNNNNIKNMNQNEINNINPINKNDDSKNKENNGKISKNYDEMRKKYIDNLSNLYESDLKMKNMKFP